MTEEEEREDLVKTTAILEKVCGERPLGWDHTGVGAHERSFRLLVEEGYFWNGDLRDDDLPYGMAINDKILVQLPHRSKATGDYGIFCLGLEGVNRAQRSHREAASFFRDTFDAYLETAKREWPQLITLVIHPYMSCIPERIGALDSMLSYMKGFPEVWFTTYIDLARYWKENYL